MVDAEWRASRPEVGPCADLVASVEVGGTCSSRSSAGVRLRGAAATLGFAICLGECLTSRACFASFSFLHKARLIRGGTMSDTKTWGRRSSARF